MITFSQFCVEFSNPHETVRNLLNLADRPGTPEEGATARKKAEELAKKHNININAKDDPTDSGWGWNGRVPNQPEQQQNWGGQPTKDAWAASKRAHESNTRQNHQAAYDAHKKAAAGYPMFTPEWNDHIAQASHHRSKWPSMK